MPCASALLPRISASRLIIAMIVPYAARGSVELALQLSARRFHLPRAAPSSRECPQWVGSRDPVQFQKGRRVKLPDKPFGALRKQIMRSRISEPGHHQQRISPACKASCRSPPICCDTTHCPSSSNESGRTKFRPADPGCVQRTIALR